MLQLDQFHQLEMNCLGRLRCHVENGHTLWKDSEKQQQDHRIRFRAGEQLLQLIL